MDKNILNLKIRKNPLYGRTQNLRIPKVSTLVGKNGSGKSMLLEKLFEQKLDNKDHQEYKIVGFTSGQNEKYTQIFDNYTGSNPTSSKSFNHDCYFFGKEWAKFIIFLASSRPVSRTRENLAKRGYMPKTGKINADGPELELKFKVEEGYYEEINRILNLSTGAENADEQTELQVNEFYNGLLNFVGKVLPDYEGDENPFLNNREILRERKLKVSLKDIADLDFSTPESYDSLTGASTKNRNSDGAKLERSVRFFMQAAHNDRFIEKSSMKLYFKVGSQKKELEMDLLSDGEYQYLLLLALIDLFDADNTIFLFDEADSHLHYTIIRELWAILYKIKGFTLTTTHLIDSILAYENQFENLVLVEKGKIIKDSKKAKLLFDRLRILTREQRVNIELCGKMKKVVLIDDLNDWLIFILLAERLGLDINALSEFAVVKWTSGCNGDEKRLGLEKIDWVKDFKRYGTPDATEEIFLICDRDGADLDWESNGVRVKGQVHQKNLKPARKSKDWQVETHLLAWQRREKKNYLIAYTPFSHHGLLELINNDNYAKKHHLKKGDRCDNEVIQNIRAKEFVDHLINREGKGLDEKLLREYISLMPLDEISIDIINMYNFLTGKR